MLKRNAGCFRLWLILALAISVASQVRAQGTNSAPAARDTNPDPFVTGAPVNPTRPAPDLFPSSSPVNPATPGEEKWGASLFGDQDSVFPWLGRWGGDQNYTMGVGIQLTGKIVSWATHPVRGLDRLFGLARLHGRLATQTTALLPAGVPAFIESHSFTLSNGVFTPRRLDQSAPIYDDRPYSSILGFTASHSTIDPYNRRAFRTDLTLGILGLRISDRIQTSIHTQRRKANQKKDPTILTPYDPMGWPHQISDGGEPTLKYTATWQQALSESKAHDIVLHTEGSLGYYTNTAVGFIGRLGCLRSDFWSTQSNPLTAVNQGFRDSASLATGAGTSSDRVPARNRSRKKIEAYIYGAARARIVVYNELLQGGVRRSDVTLDETQIEHTLREVDAGATLALRGMSVTVALTRRSPEYNVGSPRTHTWGGIYLVYRSQ